MLALIIVIAVVVIAAVALVARRLYFGNTAGVDRVRQRDPQAAARIEMQRAEEGIRGIGQKRF